jgi:hypothetical protein
MIWGNLLHLGDNMCPAIAKDIAQTHGSRPLEKLKTKPRRTEVRRVVKSLVHCFAFR